MLQNVLVMKAVIQVSLDQVSENVQTFKFKEATQTLNRMIGVNCSYFVSRFFSRSFFLVLPLKIYLLISNVFIFLSITFIFSYI